MKRTRLRTGTIRRAISHPVHKVNGHTSYPQQDRSRAHIAEGTRLVVIGISLVTPHGSPRFLRKRCTIGDGGFARFYDCTQFSLNKNRLSTGHRFFLLFVFLLATLILFPYAEAATSVPTHFAFIGSVAILV